MDCGSGANDGKLRMRMNKISDDRKRQKRVMDCQSGAKDGEVRMRIGGGLRWSQWRVFIVEVGVGWQG